jgi:hypothetical protein
MVFLTPSRGSPIHATATFRPRKTRVVLLPSVPPGATILCTPPSVDGPLDETHDTPGSKHHPKIQDTGDQEEAGDVEFFGLNIHAQQADANTD